MELPPPLGCLEREPLVLLVTGRTAVATIGGMPSVARHAAVAERLGYEPLVLYPGSMRALGAEISGAVGQRVSCVPSNAFNTEAGDDDRQVLVLAGDWYVSPGAVVDFIESTTGPALARFNDRTREVAPLARMSVASLKRIIPALANTPSGELINRNSDANSMLVDLPATERHRLSDSVAVDRAETKLFNRAGVKRESPLLRLVQNYLTLPITRRLAATSVLPLHVSAAKIALGLLAAWVITAGSWLTGVAGALLFFLSRVLDGVSSDLARAAIKDGSSGEKADFYGDLAVMAAMLWALSGRADSGVHGELLASVAFAGVVLSAWLAWKRIFHAQWTRDRDRAPGFLHVRPASFASRFANRNGTAWALLLTTVAGRPDLFLWACAVAAHVYYLLWIITDRRKQATGDAGLA
ncbi:MAG TPA: hypothetical protein EYG16_11955 [Deltaproteobacteria bacterium]|nr:hypothetical protein [Candidatus Binatota bacterium]HIL14371.1 hypothetical protein [Deltaproteobacteria bacterium]